MKWVTLGAGVLVVAVLGATGSSAYAGEKRVRAERFDESQYRYVELMDMYEERAKEQSAIIREHRAMKKKAEEQLRLSVGEKALVHEEMIKHCEGIISVARKLRSEYSGLSEEFERSDMDLFN